MRYLRAIRTIASDLYLMLVTYLPGRTGQYLRYRYWKRRLRHLGKDVQIDPGIYFQNPEFILIGDRSWIDRNVVILAGRDKSSRERVVVSNSDYCGEPGVVHIGKCVHIGVGCILSGISAGIYISDECTATAYSKLYAFSHRPKSPVRPGDTSIVFGSQVDHSRQSMLEGAIFLGENVGIALGVTILPGVSIGKNSFVVINSVVAKGRFPENSLIGGNPAERIGDRFAVAAPLRD